MIAILAELGDRLGRAALDAAGSALVDHSIFGGTVSGRGYLDQLLGSPCLVTSFDSCGECLAGALDAGFDRGVVRGALDGLATTFLGLFAVCHRLFGSNKGKV